MMKKFFSSYAENFIFANPTTHRTHSTSRLLPQFERHYRFAQKIEIEFPSKWILSIALKIWAI